MTSELLWYVPNTFEGGHRGDTTTTGGASVDHSTDLARPAEDHGWSGALLGTGWGRPDTFTVATVLSARTTWFKPLIAVRPVGLHEPSSSPDPCAPAAAPVTAAAPAGAGGPR